MKEKRGNSTKVVKPEGFSELLKQAGTSEDNPGKSLFLGGQIGGSQNHHGMRGTNKAKGGPQKKFV